MLRPKRIIAGLLCVTFFTAHIIAVSGLVGAPDALKRGEIYHGGWDEGDADLRKYLDPALVWSVTEWDGVGEGQTRLLYKDYEQVHNQAYLPRNQGRAPSCVGQAVAAAVDFLAAVEIRGGEPERRPPAPAAAGVIYGLSRIEIGGLDNTAMGGSHNLWGVQAITQYGVVARLDYALLGYDLRQPDPTRAVMFGANGVPTGLEMIAKLHPVKDYVSIDSYQECRDAIYMGCPVVVGSSQGFGDGKLTRDKDGFLVPPRRRFWPSVWNHSMVIIGVCDEGRKGCLILNSWGSTWVNGPERFGDEPAGSFWVDWEVIDLMVKQGDSFAIRGFRGYPEYKLWRPRR
jgi:hypothetical protein